MLNDVNDDTAPSVDLTLFRNNGFSFKSVLNDMWAGLQELVGLIPQNPIKALENAGTRPAPTRQMD